MDVKVSAFMAVGDIVTCSHWPGTVYTGEILAIRERKKNELFEDEVLQSGASIPPPGTYFQMKWQGWRSKDYSSEYINADECALLSEPRKRRSSAAPKTEAVVKKQSSAKKNAPTKVTGSKRKRSESQTLFDNSSRVQSGRDTKVAGKTRASSPSVVENTGSPEVAEEDYDDDSTLVDSESSPNEHISDSPSGSVTHSPPPPSLELTPKKGSGFNAPTAAKDEGGGKGKGAASASKAASRSPRPTVCGPSGFGVALLKDYIIKKKEEAERKLKEKKTERK